MAKIRNWQTLDLDTLDTREKIPAQSKRRWDDDES